MENIRTGSDVYCGDEKVGHVARLVADARNARVTDIVVDRGLLHGAKIVPIGEIERVGDDVLHLSLSREQFEHAEGFADVRYRDAEPNWSAPAGYNAAQFLLNVDVAFDAGSYGGISGKPSPFPPAPADPKPNLIRPTLKSGTPIRAANGDKVGEMAEADFHPEDGRLTRIVLRRGLLGHDHVELPLDWVDGVDEDGIILNVPAATVEQGKTSH